MQIDLNATTIELPDALPFDDVPLGSIFRLEKGNTYYMKVRLRHDKNLDGTEKFRMLELRTGDAFPPSSGNCLVAEGTIKIETWKG